MCYGISRLAGSTELDQTDSMEAQSGCKIGPLPEGAGRPFNCLVEASGHEIGAPYSRYGKECCGVKWAERRSWQKRRACLVGLPRRCQRPAPKRKRLRAVCIQGQRPVIQLDRTLGVDPQLPQRETHHPKDCRVI